MRVLRIADGVRVRCRECGKYHIVRGISGNNLYWSDASGWSGSYDCVHGIFESCQAYSLCPVHTEEYGKIGQKCIEEMRRKQKNIEDYLDENYI